MTKTDDQARDDGDEAEKPEKLKKPEQGWGVFILKKAGIAFGALVLLLGAAVLLLDTSPGRRVVADVVRSIELENGVRLEVGRISGSLYGDMVLHDVSVKDPKGEFLFSPQVLIDWRPFAFIGNHVDIRSATSEKMILQRLPQLHEVPSEGPLLPDLDIDITTLKIDSFIAEAPVTGERQVASISGGVHIASGRAQMTLDARTLAINDGAGGDTLAIKLDAVPEDNILAIELAVKAPQNGVIAAMAGFGSALELNIDGKGDWQSWDGLMTARSGEARAANIRLTARDGTFAAKGTTWLENLLPEPVGQLAGVAMQVDLKAELEERAADISARLNSEAMSLNAAGLADFSDNSFEDVKVAFVLLGESTLAENLRSDGLRALLTLDGAFATPTVQYSLNANRIVLNDIGLHGLASKGAATIDADRILIPVSARAAQISGLDTATGGKLTNVQLDGDLAIDGARVLSDNMRIRSSRIDAKAILLANIETGFYTGAIEGRISGYRIESVGIFNIETDADLKSGRGGGFALEGRVRARSTRLLNESLGEYLGGNFVAASDVNYRTDGTVRFTNLRLEAPDLRIVGGRGLYSPGGRIALTANGRSDRYGAVGVRVAGTLTNPRADIMIDRPDLGIGLANVNARIRGARNGYRFDVTGYTDYGPLAADVTLGNGGATSLTINSANLSGIAFSGKLRQTKAGPFAGKLTADGNGLGGLVRLGAKGRYQEAVFNLRANNTLFNGPAKLFIGSAIVDGRAVFYDQPYILADAQLADTRYQGFNLNAARVLINYRGGSGAAKAVIEGASGAPFRLAANATLQPELWSIALDGKVHGIAFKTARPARIVPRAGSYKLLPARINFGSGHIRLAGNYGKGLKIQSRVEHIDLAMLNAFMPGLGLGGNATGSLDFGQTSPSASPRADARLTLSGFTRTTAASVSQPVDISFSGKLLADGGEARAVIRRRGSVIGRFIGKLRPLPPGTGSWTTRMMRAPLGGGFRYNGPAETLFSFAGQTGQNLSGSMGVAADFSCRLENPCLTGIARGKNLTYFNTEYGTKLTGLDFNGAFGGDRFTIEKLSAQAGNGTVKGSGYVSLSSEAGYPVNIALDLQQARLARSDVISANATGKLQLTRTGSQTALLSGSIRLPETRHTIVREGAAQVPQLTGLRFKPRRDRVRITGEEVAEPITSIFSSVRLEVDVEAPEKLYVSGMGLESEWSADFKVTGTSAAPRMAGTFSLVRGTLGFAGRSFDLSEGRIGFTGGRTIDPTLRIIASEDIEDVAVNVEVGGRASNPQIGFSSTPGLPDDEILSRILFGSSVTNLSALQAVQLATSLNSLRGTGGGLNPLGKLRSATGVDRLRILGPDEDNGRGTALAAGQYLTDDIYVELITDTRGFTATQLEVSITPWLSVLSQAGGSGSSNVDVKVRKNY